MNSQPAATITLRSPSMGASVAWWTRASASVLRNVLPSGSTTRRSGWCSARARATWRARSSPSDDPASSSAANARARARLPDPGGPTSRYAWTGSRAAAASWRTAAGWPTTSAQGSTPGTVALLTSPVWLAQRVVAHVGQVGQPVGDRGPHGGGHVAGRRRAVDHHPAGRVGGGQGSVAPQHPLVELLARRLHAI